MSLLSYGLNSHIQMGSSICSQEWIMIECTTTNLIIAGKTPAWQFVHRQRNGPPSWEWCPLVSPAQCWRTAPDLSAFFLIQRWKHWEQWLWAGLLLQHQQYPAVRTRTKVVLPVTALAFIWKELAEGKIKCLLYLQSWEERELKPRLPQMKQQGSEELETSACVLHSSLPRQVYEGTECL